MDREEFYLVSDNDYLVSLFEQEISAVKNHWMQIGRPTMIVKLTDQMVGFNFDDNSLQSDSGKRNLLNFLISIKSTGLCSGTKVRVGRLSEMITTACVESLDFLVNQETDASKDWDTILRGHNVIQNASKLHQDGQGDVSLKKRTSIHRLIKHVAEDSESKSPLARSLGSSPVNDEFESLANVCAIPNPDPTPILSVTLGDPANIQEAVEMLKTSANCHQQVDLLHYIHSCYGGSFIVPELASVDLLLEEVYNTAMRTKSWSVVRTAAGLLRKNVNSLTSNLADLLIRQKTVSIGARPKEYHIAAPQTPDALSNIIFEYWYILSKIAKMI